ncbi:transmembrane protein, putative [Rhizoctonia solani AG-3 Rhs1AP]|nr:transmembrane protein, putative [Rhizoctonia solani AG-3 Rhs1AP]KEP49124.1 putative transmembrane protein [Rhizoctonia solani 123E]
MKVSLIWGGTNPSRQPSPKQRDNDQGSSGIGELYKPIPVNRSSPSSFNMHATWLSRTCGLTWQFWMCLFRLFAALYGTVIIAMQLHDVGHFLRFYANGRLALVMGSFQLAFSLILVLNDAFILTIDYQRTDTYIGCVATQVAISITAIFTNILALSLQPEWDTYSWLLMYQIGAKHIVARYHSNVGFLMIGIPILWSAFLSLCLLGAMLRSLFLLRSSIPTSQLWKKNTKEVLMGLKAPPRSVPSHSISGHVRAVPLSVPSGVVTCGRLIKRFFSNLLFRRVSPVETPIYAFSRNVFAVLAIAIVLLRTITALLSAQNQIGSRMVSNTCSNDDSLRFHSIRVLVENTLNPTPPINVSVRYENSEDATCSVEGTQLHLFSRQNLSTTIFHCGIGTLGPFVDYISDSELQAFYIEVRSAEPNTSAVLNSTDMPRIWLLNGEDQPQTTSDGFVDPYTHAARTYLPAWELHRGFHVEAEAKLITQKMIKSSIWRDILLHSEPIYGFSSLYPIVESSVGTFNYPNASIATAKITVTLKPGLSFRNQAGIPSPVAFTAGVCDVIEDYRSSTVLDVIGSIGGLFALLQTAHVLLFGRPLLWGLTGAKLITPFGLLGACSSRRFKRRLRERYHGNSEEDQSDTMLIGTFLRDFVIEFGPADNEQAHQVPRDPSLSNANEEGTTIPLKHLDFV